MPRLIFSPLHTLRRLPALAAALCCAAAAPARAQGTDSVVITGNPLGRSSVLQPASVLAGDGLLSRRAATLGETLDGLPGVASSGFGPNASRPTIRGLDGDRVRLLDNGGVSSDASNLSPDHAVAIDPLVTERLEVLRGPAALLYGGNATGGVVNSIDNRIPRLVPAGVSGRAEVRLGGAAAERSGAALVEGGAGAFAWHADAFGRRNDDLRVPAYIPLEDGQPLGLSRRVRNSAARAEGGALGGGWVAEQGFLGASVETYRNHYGVTVEPDVFIRLQRDRLALAGELRRLPAAFGPITQVSAQASHTRYQHEEVAGSGAVGTTFSSRGDDLRVELHHAPLAGLAGVFGLQSENLSFSALGAEAFVPTTRTRSNALFVLEELNAGPAVLSAGARVERVRVASDGDTAEAGAPHFGPAAERRFTPTNLSLGARAPLGGGWQIQASLASTERAPAYYELYANGVHVATAAYERGDALLAAERSRHVELGANWKQGAHSLSASLFSTRFSRFISLDASGREILIPGENGAPDSRIPEYIFRAVRARWQGLEIDARTRLLQRPWALDLTAGFDAVRGDNLDAGEPLPRVAPRRLRGGLEAVFDGWRAGIGLRHAARQTRVPASDRATPGYTLLDLSASGKVAGLALAGGETTWFLRLANVGNRLAYNAGAVATVRGLAPLPGRALSGGVRVSF